MSDGGFVCEVIQLVKRYGLYLPGEKKNPRSQVGVPLRAPSDNSCQSFATVMAPTGKSEFLTSNANWE
jgi:hypothetical protein